MSTYSWVLRPSKFAASVNSCPVFEEDQSYGAVYKNRGTDLHALVEKPDQPLEGLDPDDIDQVEFCRDWVADFESTAAPAWVGTERSFKATDHHPPGKVDYIALVVTESGGSGLNIRSKGEIYVADFKFGTQIVDAEDNMQLKAYAVMAHSICWETADITAIHCGIIQPAAGAPSWVTYTLDDLETFIDEMKSANDRVADPFRVPDPTDSSVCKRCKHLSRCPAVNGTVDLAIKKMELLPMPEQFNPGSLVSERDRVIAQDLAGILEAWATQVKKNNKEFALANDMTIGGIYNVNARGNGYAVEHLEPFAEALVESGLIQSKEDLLHYCKLAKGKLIEGLSEVNPTAEVKEKVKELEQQYGQPRPEVLVMRRGGKRAVVQMEQALNVPMLKPFWK